MEKSRVKNPENDKNNTGAASRKAGVTGRKAGAASRKNFYNPRVYKG